MGGNNRLARPFDAELTQVMEGRSLWIRSKRRGIGRQWRSHKAPAEHVQDNTTATNFLTIADFGDVLLHQLASRGCATSLRSGAPPPVDVDAPGRVEILRAANPQTGGHSWNLRSVDEA